MVALSPILGAAGNGVYDTNKLSFRCMYSNKGPWQDEMELAAKKDQNGVDDMDSDDAGFQSCILMSKYLMCCH